MSRTKARIDTAADIASTHPTQRRLARAAEPVSSSRRTAVTTLPLALEPIPDEAWHSYLTRRAAQHGCTVATLTEHIGLQRGGRWPAYHGVILDQSVTEHVAPLLGLPAEAVQRMHLSRYDQAAFDLEGLLDNPGIDATRRVVHRQWTWLSGAAYCPSCLTTDGAWRLSWRLPWITTCLAHDRALVGHCPACGGVPGLANVLGASAPSRVAVAPDGRLCTHPEPHRRICAHDLSTVIAHHAGPERLARTRLLRQVIETGSGTVAGKRHTSLRTLDAWRTAISIATRLGVVDAQGWGRTHRQGTPPRDPDVIDRLLAVAEPLIDATDVDAAADVLARWCTAAGITSPHVDTFERICQPAAAVKPVIAALLSRYGRAHTRLNRRLVDVDGAPITPGYEVGDIPQVAWPCALPPHLRDSSRPDHRILRAVISMALVRAVDPGGWIQAGAALGLPADKARGWTRYAFSEAQFPGQRGDLIAAALRLGPLLAARSASLRPQPDRTQPWTQRPHLDPTRYGVTILHTAQAPDCRRTDASSAWCPCTASAVDAARTR